jgi:hypothetical protein
VSCLAAEEQLEEAIEFVGRALVIRIQRFDILTSKTAESHFQLGSLFFHTDDFLGSEREITTAKSIDSKLFNECSIVVSGVKFYLHKLPSNINNTPWVIYDLNVLIVFDENY